MKTEINKVKWELWGELANRYRSEKPRRMLALDGGGIRGLITLQVLVRLEKLLSEKAPNKDDFKLCDFFDYIGGTSTGAIISAGLAVGMSTKKLLDFYYEFGREVFSKRSWFERWKSLYDNGKLERKLKELFGDKTDLRPENLRSLLLVVTRNATTDSAWPISSNPSAKYNAPDRKDCNLLIPLWKIVRASTAAPIFFPPEIIQWDPDDPAKEFVFVDGGTTSYNNPAFLMFRMATESAYKLCWRTGEHNLLVVSIGTGSALIKGSEASDPEMNILSNIKATLGALMSQAKVDQDINCRTVGRCTYGGFLDREIGDLIPRDDDGKLLSLEKDLGRAFLYTRYDADLTHEGLSELSLSDIDPVEIGRLDSVDHIDDLLLIGERLAERVNLAHFGLFL